MNQLGWTITPQERRGLSMDALPEERYVECVRCGDYFHIDRMEEFSDGLYCPDCAEIRQTDFEYYNQND